MRPALLAIAGPLTGATLDLGEGKVSIGRHPSNELCVPSKWVSRSHCQIVPNGERFKIVDLKSSHGTFVNGIPVTERILRKGDRIGVGDCLFLFVLREESDRPESDPLRALESQLIAKTASHLRLEDAPYLQFDKPSPSEPAKAPETAGDLGLLLRVNSELNALRHLSDVRQCLLRLALDYIPAERAAILFGGETPEEFTEIVALNRDSAVKEPIRVSRAIATQVLRDATAILTNDLVETGGRRASRSRSDPAVQGVLCAPLAVTNQVLGVLYLDTRDPKVRFKDDHLRLLTGIAGVGATAIANIRRIEELEGEAQRVAAEVHLTESMVGNSAPMQEVHQFIGRVAETDATVLIQGETGTGKELVARAIHANSPRAAGPFQAISCAALTDTLLESELFGHERGAFTGAIAQKRGKFEVADGGTVFLDEIGELAPAIQVKLLRVLQELEFERVGGTRPVKVDIRLIAATNRDLNEAVRSGTFRKDLYYRINVVMLKMPPLRERREDIPLLADYFAAKYGSRFKRRIAGLSNEARECLLSYDWPGNVRELENAVERAVVLCCTDVIRPEDLPESLLEVESPGAPSISTYHGAIKDLKKKVILKALEEARGSPTRAAKSLGVHPNYLHRLIRNLGLKTAGKE